MKETGTNACSVRAVVRTPLSSDGITLAREAACVQKGSRYVKRRSGISNSVGALGLPDTQAFPARCSLSETRQQL